MFSAIFISLVFLGIFVYFLHDFLLFLASPGETENGAPQAVTSNSRPQPSGVKEPSESAIVVDPQRLVEDYRANEVAADMAYKGKILQITGAVASINKDFLDEPYVVIAGYFQGLSGIECRFRKSDELALSRLQIGQLITASGRCSGMTMLTVFLKDCALVPPETPEQKNAREDRELRAQIAREVGITIDESGKVGGTPRQGTDFAINYVERTGKPFTVTFCDQSGKPIVKEMFLIEDGKVVARDVTNEPPSN